MGQFDGLKNRLGTGQSDPQPRSAASLKGRLVNIRVDRDLRTANRLLGPNGVRSDFFWPDAPRSEWPNNYRTARQLRETAFKTALSNMAGQQPHLKPFLDRVKYQPEKIRSLHSCAQTGGWIDDLENQPYCNVNDSAFKDQHFLQRTLRHEIWHWHQRQNPQLFRGGNAEERKEFRDFDAHLRDLESENEFQLRDEEEFWSLRNAYDNLQATMQRTYWQQFDDKTKKKYLERFERERTRVCGKLANTYLSKDPYYDLICKRP